MKRRVDVLLGLQYGSEGKGLAAAYLAKKYPGAYGGFIRIGGSNAGHSFTSDGRKYVMRHVPCGLVTAKDAFGYIARGALLDEKVLLDEMEQLRDRPSVKLFIDDKVQTIQHFDKAKEREESIGSRLGSTCKGVGAAQARLVMRYERWPVGFDVLGKAALLPRMAEFLKLTDKAIMLESTQGHGLSLYADCYPFCTSRDIGTAASLSEARVPIGMLRHVIGVIRTRPIRVGGNSGPMHGEMTWDQIAAEAGMSVVAPEITTVTQKQRRVGRFDWDQVKEAVELHGVTHLFITFMDYLNVRARMCESYADLPGECKEFVDQVMRRTGCRVGWVSKGPDVDIDVLEVDDSWKSLTN